MWSEMKEMLREMNRGSRGANSGNGFAPPLDTYDPPVESKSDKEFVLPEPISRRLDAERGIHRDPSEDLELASNHPNDGTNWR